MNSVFELCTAAKSASYEIALLDTEKKNKILCDIADAIISKKDMLICENERDIAIAKENNMRESLIDRLTLTEARIEAMAEGARQVATLPDPIGTTLSDITRPNGINIKKVCVPLGVIGIIFESRPNVTLDAAVLCLKSGNATVLRGGKEAIYSNMAITAVMREVLAENNVSPDAICLIEDTTRNSASELMNMKGLIDVLIPRGGAGLIRAVVENAKVPVIETGAGNCHLYVDKHANLEMAVNVLTNAKCSRPSVCNAVETALVHADVAESFLPKLKEALSPYNVEIRGDAECARIIPCSPATDDDWETEYNDFILAIKIVKDIKEAIAHIARYNTMHSEAIITDDTASAELFTKSVDAAAVYVNASTRFTDGFEFGLGAEIGISTQKMHARGPMGLEELTSIKYLIHGNGQIR
ncbi:MAG: glutamate-5-semialdehyde dehydrogenase [Clostridia bacterium]|nr:glutamate-5-semialdehyde dehydrogenase [Clostridia bacterium]